MSKSKIEWTEQTWNPIVGCSPALGSENGACRGCYAMGQVHRFGASYRKSPGLIRLGNQNRDGLTFLPTAPDGETLGKGAKWTGEVWLLPAVLQVPLHRRKPTTYFVNSLSDVFHESVVGSEEGRRFITAMFGVMAACPQHRFQILTKRPEQAVEWFAWLEAIGPGRFLFQHLDDMSWQTPEIVIASIQGHPERRVEWPLPNVWIGVSVENQECADKRIPLLLELPATTRFLSCEPLLGNLKLREWLGADKVSWAIAGGESGHCARPMHPDWARSIRDQCVAAGVPYFFKQWGEWAVPDQLPDAVLRDVDATDRGPDLIDAGRPIRVGKAAAGRELDGRTWDEFPEVAR